MMSVYISYDFEDQPQFENIVDALVQADVPYWDPGSMRPGASLAEQLRDAICAAKVCIFIATHRSVASAWCGAELGAFWGAEKPVVIYIADPSLSEDQLPKQFQGQFFLRRITKVVAEAKRYLTDAAEPKIPHAVASTVVSVSAEELQAMIESAVERTQGKIFVSSVMGQIVETISENDLDSLEPDQLRGLRFALHNLLGISATAAKAAAQTWWHYQSSFTTSTGLWSVYALEEQDFAMGDVEVYRRTLLLRFDADQRIAAAAIVKQLSDMRGLGTGVQWSEPLALAGVSGLGTAHLRYVSA